MAKRPLTPAAATALTLVMLVVLRTLQRAGADQVVLTVWGGVTALCATQIVWGLWVALRFDYLTRLMTMPTGLYGRTATPTAEDAETLGL